MLHLIAQTTRHSVSLLILCIVWMKRFKLSATYLIQRNLSGLVTYSCLFRFEPCKTVYIEQKTSTLFGKASWTLGSPILIKKYSRQFSELWRQHKQILECAMLPRNLWQKIACSNPVRRDPPLKSFLFPLKFADVAFYPGKTTSESQTFPLWTPWIEIISRTTDTLNYAKNTPLILNHPTKLSTVTLTFHEKISDRE